MIYEYSGYLRTVLDAPDPGVRDALPQVRFGPDDLAQWSLKDLPSDLEWQHIPANFRRTEAGVHLEGRFNAVHQIDNLSADDPSFWVALSSLGWSDERFPVDVSQYSIAEITYRCTSPNARPAWVSTYSGGFQFDGLPPTQEWRTMARSVQPFGFPPRVNAVILRLYSTVRGVESFEVESVRFRAMSLIEVEACRARDVRLEPHAKPRSYPLLDTFLPFGCQMDAGSSKRLAAMLGVSFEEYWALTLEDLVKHYHNCIALEKTDRLTSEEWRGLLDLAASYGIKFFPIHELPADSPHAYCQEFIANHVKPHAASSAVLAWSLHHKAPEHAFKDVLHARTLIEDADPNHPMAVIERNTNAAALFAPFLPVVGIEHFRSHVPWEVSELVQMHLPLCSGQQLWVVAPGFVYATDTPEWHSCPEMRMMVSHALANGARGWFTFAYHNDPIWVRGSCQRSLTGPFLTFSDLWSELGQRVEHWSALAPLLLGARPEPALDPWFGVHSIARANAQIPEGFPPASVTRLRADDYDLYCLVSNDVREMTTVHIDVDSAAIQGFEFYDVTDYVRMRQWTPMERRRHLEMFPGQMHMVLAAKPEVCTRLRDSIAEGLVENDRRVLFFDLALTQVYGIRTTDIEKMIEDVQHHSGHEALSTMQHVREALLNLVYSSPVIYEPRSKIIEASAAVCACDGSLCRLLGRGKVEQARQWGFKVVPLAREFTNLRLELRRGRGAAILDQCNDLAQRALNLLAEIRAIA